MARKKILMKFSELVKSIKYAHESAVGDELDTEYAQEMSEFIIDDLGLASYVEMDEVEEDLAEDEDEDDAA